MEGPGTSRVSSVRWIVLLIGAVVMCMTSGFSGILQLYPASCAVSGKV